MPDGAAGDAAFGEDAVIDDVFEQLGLDAATLGAAVRLECRRTFRPPYEIPVIVAVNAALLLVLWWLLPQSAITRLTGNFALPLCLASWMFSDVPATNTLAPDRVRVLAALDQPVQLRRLMLAKNATLWLIATPIGIAATVIVGAQTGEWTQAGIVALAVATVPLGLLGISSWLGILYPYHPRKLDWRWEHRRQLRLDARWMTLVLLPYMLVPALAVIMATPSILVWDIIAKHGLSSRLDDVELLVGVAIAITISLVAWFWGTRGALRLIRIRHDELAAYLDDPERG